MAKISLKGNPIETIGTRTDFRMIQDLAAALGSSLAPNHVEDVLREIHEAVPAGRATLPSSGGQRLRNRS